MFEGYVRRQERLEDLFIINCALPTYRGAYGRKAPSYKKLTAHRTKHNKIGNIDEGTGANDLQANVSVLGGLLAEIIFTCVFVLVVLGATAKTNGATNNFAGLAIGLSLILVHLVCIRYTGTSVNPVRSIAPAVFQGGTALANLWIFIVGPLVGGACAAGIWKMIDTEK